MVLSGRCEKRFCLKIKIGVEVGKYNDFWGGDFFFEASQASVIGDWFFQTSKRFLV